MNDFVFAPELEAVTVEDLLRLPEGRRACWDCVHADKCYSGQAGAYARRRAVIAAVARLRDRWARVQAWRIAEQARAASPGRIAALCKQRKIKCIKDGIARAAKACGYRVSSSSWAGGDHTTTVSVGDAISVKGESSREWSKNGKWSGTNSAHTFCVRADWMQRVGSQNLVVCNSMLTLHAECIVGSGPELFRAVWVEQGRGFELKSVRGFIARIGEHTYHASSAKSALAGVQRKAGQQPERRAVDLDRLAHRYGQLPVCLDDAKKCGLCPSGTRSWCAAVGVSVPETRLSDVIAGYRLRPLPEALRVIRYVVREHRQLRAR